MNIEEMVIEGDNDTWAYLYKVEGGIQANLAVDDSTVDVLFMQQDNLSKSCAFAGTLSNRIGAKYEHVLNLLRIMQRGIESFNIQEKGDGC